MAKLTQKQAEELKDAINDAAGLSTNEKSRLKDIVTEHTEVVNPPSLFAEVRRLAQQVVKLSDGNPATDRYNAIQLGERVQSLLAQLAADAETIDDALAKAISDYPLSNRAEANINKVRMRITTWKAE